MLNKRLPDSAKGHAGTGTEGYAGAEIFRVQSSLISRICDGMIGSYRVLACVVYSRTTVISCADMCIIQLRDIPKSSG